MIFCQLLFCVSLCKPFFCNLVGYITERVGNEPKLRKIVVANGIIVCLRANNSTDPKPKWKLPLSKITIEEDSRTEEIDVNTRHKINKLGKHKCSKF